MSTAMTQERFNQVLQEMVEAGELDCLCPFSRVPIQIDGTDCLQGADNGYGKCCGCPWFGFDDRNERASI